MKSDDVVRVVMTDVGGDKLGGEGCCWLKEGIRLVLVAKSGQSRWE
jgi:hypothetical protein